MEIRPKFLDTKNELFVPNYTVSYKNIWSRQTRFKNCIIYSKITRKLEKKMILIDATYGKDILLLGTSDEY